MLNQLFLLDAGVSKAKNLHTKRALGKMHLMRPGHDVQEVIKDAHRTNQMRELERILSELQGSHSASAEARGMSQALSREASPLERNMAAMEIDESASECQ